MTDYDRPCDGPLFDTETDRTTWLNARVRRLTPAEMILAEAHRAGATVTGRVAAPVASPRRPSLEIVTADYRGPQPPCDVA